MKISENGKFIIRSFESRRLKAYPDPKTGGDPWTIGDGHTGPDVYKGLIWTDDQCDAAFDKDIMSFERDVTSLVTRPINQDQFDALVSFAYNCGSDIDADTKAEGLGDSTLLKYVNAGRFIDAANEFLKWISKGTPVEKGLRRRRSAERALFLGEPGWKSFL